MRKRPKLNLHNLRRLQKAHLLQVPFENLDIHAGVPIALDINQIYHKIILNKRGGFCYELNGLFYELLHTIGYEVQRISARVYSVEKGFSPEFDHMALIVTIEEQKYLCDVGFGEFCFAPLPLQWPTQYVDARGIFHIDEYPEEYICIGKTDETGQKRPEYKFQPIPRQLEDFQEMCLYQQHDPDSHFRQKPLISLATSKGRITLAGQELKIRKGNKLISRKLSAPSAFQKAAWKYFRIQVPPFQGKLEIS